MFILLARDESAPVEELTIFQDLTFDVFQRKFAVCSKSPSRVNHRKPSYPWTQERDQGAG